MPIYRTALQTPSNILRTKRIFAIYARLNLLLCFRMTYCWQQWKYSTYSTDDWRDIWGYPEGPRGRRGHSIVLSNQTKLVLFGGRDNEIHKTHVPKTYELIEKEGEHEFTTYDNKPLHSQYNKSCEPVKSCVSLENASSGNTESCSVSWDHVLTDGLTADQRRLKEDECGFKNVGLYYNDVWVYELDCLRYADLECQNDGWRVVHPGAIYGGCHTTQEGERVCDVPSERWGHGSAMIDDTTMVIYGGFSHECEDYCDDVWSFDFTTMRWSEVSRSQDGPGKRWKFSMVGSSRDPQTGYVMILVFGGHRLWQGFATDNAEENRWKSQDVYPEGGYLNDLWVLSKNESSSSSWSKLQQKQSCYSSPGTSWESRNDISCKVHWPQPRSGHAAVFDDSRRGMWVHGGFTAHYPYPLSNSPGSGYGVKSDGRDGDGPYPTYPYYLNDLWFYDVTSGYWEEKKPTSLINPVRRRDHLLVLFDNILLLYGGYADNHYYNDTWFYFVDENRWLEKKEFVHGYYPETCTDDISEATADPNCIELEFPADLKRSNRTTQAINYQDILPFKEQVGYTPDAEKPLYFGIVDDAEAFVSSLRVKYLENEVYDEDGNRIWIQSGVPDGTPIAPNAATGPRQYARRRQLVYNDTATLEVWEWCISVKGEPTRGKATDGKGGRSNNTIFIPQPRRQSPGWDGCRELHWKYPPSRSGHASIFVEKFKLLLFYGGIGYADGPQSPSLHVTHKTKVLDDFWVLHVHHCAHNCSGHGVCKNGLCKCDPGYYGMDCSNYTCPGSVCYYDEDHVQQCTHCCHDGYEHSDDDAYVTGIRKVPCRPKSNGGFTGNSEGICDGFGTCQCAPPFLGDDCSIKDCKNNCSFNGYCSVEYPVSRCVCKDGYFGEYCQHRECLNNCSYPNGICDIKTGECGCNSIPSPYNKSIIWSFWEGEDCSYLAAWCASNQVKWSWFILITGWCFIYITTMCFH